MAREAGRSPQQDYEVRVSETAKRQLDQLDARSADAAIKLLRKELQRQPEVGLKLRGSLQGSYSMKGQGFRVLYRIDHGSKTVLVKTIEPR